MTNPEQFRKQRDLPSIHERILRTAAKGEALPEVNLEQVSRIAQQALAAAASKGQGIAAAERAALEALDGADLDAKAMKGRAVGDLDELLAEVPRRSTRLDFVVHFVFAALLPIVGGALIWWLATSRSVDAARFTFGLLATGLGAALLAAVVLVAKGQRSLFSRSNLGATLAGSGGAITAGLVVLVSIGSMVQHYGAREQQAKYEQRLIVMNQAAAVTLAAVNADASVLEAQAAVSRVPEARWFHVRSTEPLAGTVLAEGNVTQQLSAQLRTVSIPASEGGIRFAAYVADRSGQFRPYLEYVVGTVVSADIDKVVISNALASTTRTYSLPSGTLPPTVKATVVAAAKPNSDRALFLQSIDGVAQDLAKR